MGEPPDASIGVRIAVAAPLGVAAAVLVGLHVGLAVRARRRVDRRRRRLSDVDLAERRSAWTPDATARHATRYRDDDSTPWILDLAVLVASVASLAAWAICSSRSPTGGDVVAAVVGR